MFLSIIWVLVIKATKKMFRKAGQKRLCSESPWPDSNVHKWINSTKVFALIFPWGITYIIENFFDNIFMSMVVRKESKRSLNIFLLPFTTQIYRPIFWLLVKKYSSYKPKNMNYCWIFLVEPRLKIQLYESKLHN